MAFIVQENTNLVTFKYFYAFQFKSKSKFEIKKL